MTPKIVKVDLFRSVFRQSTIFFKSNLKRATKIHNLAGNVQDCLRTYRENAAINISCKEKEKAIHT